MKRKVPLLKDLDKKEKKEKTEKSDKLPRLKLP